MSGTRNYAKTGPADRTAERGNLTHPPGLRGDDGPLTGLATMEEVPREPFGRRA